MVTDWFNMELSVGFLTRYLMMMLFGAALLVGIQLPNLADQYGKRVDAHLKEVLAIAQPYQEVADRYAGGSLKKLVALHRQSSEAVFRAEADAIENVIERKQRFEAEAAAMQAPLPQRLLHIAMVQDRELLDETIDQYTFNVPLTQEAVIFGAGLALAAVLLLDVVLFLVRVLSAGLTRFVNHRLR